MDSFKVLMGSLQMSEAYMVLDATQRHHEPLTADRLFGWHAALFPTVYSSLTKIRFGQWRDDAQAPMQVVSGPIHRQKVHYEAPPAHLLDAEMLDFLNWFNVDQHDDPVVKAGLAHLWFVTIHPFEDGNGRIARAVGDMALARAEQSAQRYYSLSAQIQRERNDYYDRLEATQKGSLDVTDWLAWFLACLLRAVQGAEQTLAQVLVKARFWQHCVGGTWGVAEVPGQWTHASVSMVDLNHFVLLRELYGISAPKNGKGCANSR